MCSVAQLCLTLFNSMECNLLGSSVPGIVQARILEQLPFSTQGIFQIQAVDLRMKP